MCLTKHVCVLFKVYFTHKCHNALHTESKCGVMRGSQPDYTEEEDGTVGGGQTDFINSSEMAPWSTGLKNK